MTDIQETAEKLETDIRGLGLMIKGLFDLVGTGIEHADIDALNNAYSRLYSSYREYSIEALVKMGERNVQA
jgi:hypothetical protein